MLVVGARRGLATGDAIQYASHLEAAVLSGAERTEVAPHRDVTTRASR